MTDIDRKQCYLAMSMDLVKDFLRARNGRTPDDDEVLNEWNRRFDDKAKLFTGERAMTEAA